MPRDGKVAEVRGELRCHAGYRALQASPLQA
jgi:hypothetical protein